MITVKIGKLFQSQIVSVRDYIVKDCISKGIILRIKFKNQFMDLSPEELKSQAFQMTKRSFSSKFKNQKYQLLDFYWKPSVEKNEDNFYRQSMSALSSHAEQR